NDFQGVLSLNSTGSVSVTDVNALTLGTVAVGGNLSVNAAGALTQTGPAAVAGLTTLNDAANPITLNNASNNFATVAATAASSVSLVDVNALDLGAITVSGALTVNAGGALTDSGSLSVPGTATFTAGTLTLDNPGNALFGPVLLTAAQA